MSRTSMALGRRWHDWPDRIDVRREWDGETMSYEPPAEIAADRAAGCEWCEGERPLDLAYADLDSTRGVDPSLHVERAVLLTEDGPVRTARLALDDERTGEEGIAQFLVRFCPMCGRRLEER